jgi:hypothetical protein
VWSKRHSSHDTKPTHQKDTGDEELDELGKDEKDDDIQV